MKPNLLIPKTYLWLFSIALSSLTSSTGFAQKKFCGDIFQDNAVKTVHFEQLDAYKFAAAVGRAFEDKSIPTEKLVYFNSADGGDRYRPTADAVEIVSEETIIESRTIPVSIPIGMSFRFGGGAILFHKKVYPNAFFLQRKSDLGERQLTPSDWTNIIESQGVLKWLPEEQRFALETNQTASHSILTSLKEIHGDTISLFRGTTLLGGSLGKTVRDLQQGQRPDYNEVLEGIKKQEEYLISRSAPATKFADLKKMKEDILRMKSASTTDIASLKKDLPVIQNYLLKLWQDSKFGAVFTTPNRATAEFFTKGQVLEYQVSISKLLELADKREVYVGFEDQIELAFPSTTGQLFLMNSLKSSSELAPDGNIWN